MDNESRKSTLTGLVILGFVLGYVAWTHLPTLDHDYLPGWDEAVHAGVAGNLAKHPGTPTLFDQPFIAYDHTDWQANHVWLHMPPMPFWQAALSVGLGERSFFNLRLPNLLLFLLTLVMIYRLGLLLYDEGTGLLAAALMALCPFAWLQVQGYHFGDMTDISLAFWLTATVLASVQAMKKQAIGWSVTAGLCLTAALLTKSALALAPAGAIVVLYLLPKLGFRLQTRLRWTLPALVVGISFSLAFAWRTICAWRWPTEFQHEQSTLWAHVTSSYEGHGRSWDALFNSLLANLFTPPFVLLCLAGVILVLARAYRKRETAVGMHALWLAGTMLPLLFVQTKVPALLFGLFPALSLAMAALILRQNQKQTLCWSALLATPLLFLWGQDWLGNDFWSFATPIAPDLAAQPGLLLLLGFFGILTMVLVVFRYALPKSDVFGWGVSWLAKASLIGALIWLAFHSAQTRDGFGIIKDYNPAAPIGRWLDQNLPRPAAVIIEGKSNGRQRNDLTVAFLSGQPAHVVSSRRLDQSLRPAREKGAVFLLSPVERDATAVFSPEPGAGFWVYPVKDALPEPRHQEAGPHPLLRGLSAQKASVAPGRSLHLLGSWLSGERKIKCTTSTRLTPADGSQADPGFPREEDFPTGMAGTVLHTLAPPGLLWGQRPLGNDLFHPERLAAGQTFVDDFMIWIPKHLPPGSYQIRLEIHCGGRAQKVPDSFQWPRIEVQP